MEVICVVITYFSNPYKELADKLTRELCVKGKCTNYGHRLKHGTCCAPGACDPQLVERGIIQDKEFAQMLIKNKKLKMLSNGQFEFINHPETDEPFFFKKNFMRRGGACLVPKYRNMTCQAYFCTSWREHFDNEQLPYQALAKSAAQLCDLSEIKAELATDFEFGCERANPGGYLLFCNNLSNIKEVAHELQNCLSETLPGIVFYNYKISDVKEHFRPYKGIAFVIDEEKHFASADVDVNQLIVNTGNPHSGIPRNPIFLTTCKFEDLFAGQKNDDLLWKNAITFHALRSFVLA